jgi:tetratricopeptide (TPR) repeat protein
MRSELGHVYASSGNRDRAIGILSELLEQKKTGYRSAFRIAQIEASLGAREAALKNLENAFEEKDPFLSFLEIDPILRVKLGEELRYKKMREYMATR